jgi:hypothetical protein
VPSLLRWPFSCEQEANEKSSSAREGRREFFHESGLNNNRKWFGPLYGNAALDVYPHYNQLGAP